MATFASERDWGRFHVPRNLLLALVGEVGELAELFQWRGEVAVGLPDWPAADKVHLGEELSDVLLYLVRLADRCDVDLGAAARRKLLLNARKYPVGQAKGSSDKYTAYVADAAAVAAQLDEELNMTASSMSAASSPQAFVKTVAHRPAEVAAAGAAKQDAASAVHHRLGGDGNDVNEAAHANSVAVALWPSAAIPPLLAATSPPSWQWQAVAAGAVAGVVAAAAALSLARLVRRVV
jgi:NTP pyrophosphatase (non-canonical NTP hydrolase)